MKQYIISISLLVLLSFWSIRPLLHSGFFSMHDDTQVGRVVVMGRALRHGQFPVRWVNDLGYGYGYPIFNFYGPLPYYVGGVFYALGFDALVSTKIMFLLGIVLSGITMYILARSVFRSSWAGLIAGMFYIYAPYHAVDIYVRGAVGEFWTMVFFPLFFYGLWHIQIEDKQKSAVLLGSIGYAGIILSHTILGFLLTEFIGIGLFGFFVVQLLRRRILRKENLYVVFMLLVGLGMSAFFWLPAVVERGYTNVLSQIGPTANFRDHFVCLDQLWNSAWGFGGSVKGCIDGMSFKLGKLHIIGALIFLGLWIWKQKEDDKRRLVVWMSLAIGVVSVYLMLPISESFWNFLPLSSFVQYPWRLLVVTIFSLSLLSSGLSGLYRQSIFFTGAVSIVLLGCVIGLNAKLFVPQYIYERSASEFESAQELNWRVSKISDEYLPASILRPVSLDDIPKGVLPDVPFHTELEIDTETYIKMVITSNRVTSFIVNRAYFPGWRYWVNGREVQPPLHYGLPQLTVIEGNNVVELRFANTLVRSIGNLISSVTIVGLLYMYGKKTVS